MSNQFKGDKEILAISTVYAALKELDENGQARVIEYVVKKLNIKSEASSNRQEEEAHPEPEAGNGTVIDTEEIAPPKAEHGDDFSSISPVAQKWIQRSGLQTNQLSSIFSIGGEEIDLVANSVPGKSARARMRSVFLLKGIAAYLGGGAARIAHDKVKEACVHYQAYDSKNFATYVRDLAPEVSGSKESGYTLTPRGIANAAKLVRQMLGIDKEKQT